MAGPTATPRTPLVTPSAVCGPACCPRHGVGCVLLVPDVLHPTDLIEVLDEGVVRHVVWQVGLVVRLVVWVRLVIAAVTNSCKKTSKSSFNKDQPRYKRHLVKLFELVLNLY